MARPKVGRALRGEVRDMRVVFLGAGAIGCFVGGHWARAGLAVTLVGRERVSAGFRDRALHLSGGGDVHVPPGTMTLAHGPDALSEAKLVFVATKALGADRAADEIEAHAPTDAVVVSLMNGVRPTRRLAERLAPRTVLPGMVPFNVSWSGPAHLHRSSAGRVAVESAPATRALANAVKGSGAPVELHVDLLPLQRGKLLLNLVGPVNALSGLPLRATLAVGGYRGVFAAALREALSVYDAAGLSHEKAGPIPSSLAEYALRLPDPIFRATILRLQGIDDQSLTSMAQDVSAGRLTEVDELNGEIVRMAETAGIDAPVNRALCELIERRNPNDTPMTSDALRQAVGLPCDKRSP